MMTTMTARTELRQRLEALQAGAPAQEDLAALWEDCSAVLAGEILGDWAGTDFDTPHPVHRLLLTSRWHGKRFVSPEEAHPLVLHSHDGRLVSDRALGKGLASLWNIEFRGRVTAAMVYDGQPVIDHLVAVDDDTLLGVMNGKGTRFRGLHYYFVLARSAAWGKVPVRDSDRTSS